MEDVYVFTLSALASMISKEKHDRTKTLKAWTESEAHKAMSQLP
jgi:hypothetical protein